MNINSHNKNGKFKIFHQNIRFAANKKAPLEVILSDVEPDLVCLTELALFCEEVGHYGLHQFQLASSFCRLGNRGGGAGIFVSDQYFSNCKMIDISSFCCQHILEAAAVLISLNNCKFIVLCIYRPPSDLKAHVDNCIDLLSDMLEFLVNIEQDIVLIGDTNICTMADSYKKTELFNLITTFNLHCSTTFTSTRVTGNTASAIDSIFTNFDQSLYKTGSLKTGLTDHDAIFLELSVGKNKKFNSWLQYNVNEEGIQAFQYFLSENEWRHVLECQNAQEAFSKFHNNLICIFKLCFHLKKNIVSNKPSKPSYLRDVSLHGLRAEIITLSELIKTKEEPALLEKLKLCKIKYSELIAASKMSFYDEKLLTAENKVKTAWQIVNNETRRHKVVKQQIKVRNDSGELVQSDEACLLFNNHFLSVPQKVIADVEKLGSRRATDPVTERYLEESIFLYPVTEEEVSDTIKKLKPKNSSGYDFISNNLIKKIAP